MDKRFKQLENSQNEVEYYFMENFFNEDTFDIQLFYDFLGKESNKETKKKYVEYFLYKFFPYLPLSFTERLDILADLKKYNIKLVTLYELNYLLTFFEKIPLLEFDKVYKDDEENKSKILSLLEDYKNKSTWNGKLYLQSIIYFLKWNYDKYDETMLELIENHFFKWVENYVDYLFYNLEENKTANTIDDVERKLNLISKKLGIKEPLAVFYEIIWEKEKSREYYKKAAENIELNALLYLVQNEVLKQVEIEKYIQNAEKEQKEFNDLENMIFDFIKWLYYINYEYNNKNWKQYLLLAFEQAKILQNKEIILELAKLLFEIIDDKEKLSQILQVVSYYDMDLAKELWVENFEKEKNYMWIIWNYMFEYVNNFDHDKIIWYFKKHLYAVMDELVNKKILSYGDLTDIDKLKDKLKNYLKNEKKLEETELVKKSLNLLEIVSLLEEEKNTEDKSIAFLLQIFEKIYYVFKEDNIKFLQNIFLNLLLDLPYSKFVLYYVIKDNFKEGVWENFYEEIKNKYILFKRVKFENTNDLEKFLLKVFDEIFAINNNPRNEKMHIENITKLFEILASFYSEKDNNIKFGDLLININPENKFFITNLGYILSIKQIERKIPYDLNILFNILNKK